jgi:hypothetical protein
VFVALFPTAAPTHFFQLPAVSLATAFSVLTDSFVQVFFCFADVTAAPVIAIGMSRHSDPRQHDAARAADKNVS